MGKRSNFERVERDFYPTPLEAVLPLLDHLPDDFTFAEPCAGKGDLVCHLENLGGTCTWASDIEHYPGARNIEWIDFSELSDDNVSDSNFIITNPPWNRKILHPMIEHFSSLRPTWLLFDADWAHTKQSAPYIEKCAKIVSVGRVKWFGNMTGKDNCAWYLFYNNTPDTTTKIDTEFYGRT